MSTINIEWLINNCPAPVSTSGDITDALFWLDIVDCWVRTQPETEILNKQKIINMCNLYTPEIVVGYASDDYATVNNYLMHVRSALTAINAVNEDTPPTPDPDPDPTPSDDNEG